MRYTYQITPSIISKGQPAAVGVGGDTPGLVRIVFKKIALYREVAREALSRVLEDLDAAAPALSEGVAADLHIGDA